MSNTKKSPPLRKKALSQALQIKSFEEAAREVGCDDDPAHFDEVLKKVARHKPPTVEKGSTKENVREEKK